MCRPGSPYHWVVLVTHVCQRWRIVALDYTKLWSALRIMAEGPVHEESRAYSSETCIVELLRRSQLRPLGMTVIIPEDTEVSWCMSLAVRQMHRTHTSRVQTGDHHQMSLAVEHLTMGAPQLEQLVLEITAPSDFWTRAE